MRKLAAFVAASNFDVFAVCDVESGDALALATRFALQWAYRGRQALFWTARYQAKACRDEYLPFNPARPFERRATIQIEGACDGSALTLFATRFSDDRGAWIPQLRVVRSSLRAAEGAALLFAGSPQKTGAFADLGFEIVDAARPCGIRARSPCTRDV
jgi:hypothetical protein